ncbi:ORF6N domain-containing protein [bacterium]|nr:ORF6N domain-containing protein [bacterium]MBU1063770.1 ORF6N domain-containing protein [bacterium]MBU1634455.1 ORF6N domain-containing protein [bacterium]MBU1874613.1 ORF6N domain-containing protein [bacterium]
MSKEKQQIISIGASNIQNLIYTIRGEQVMLDSDLAKIYGVETRVLNQAVTRNINRFPEKFRFKLAKEEITNLKSQNVISSGNLLTSQNVTLKKSRGKHRKYLPYAFTEQGVAMLSSVLKSETAVRVSIQIIDAFVNMRRFIGANAQLFQRIDKIELKQLQDKSEIDEKFNQVFDAIEQKEITPKQGIISNGQIFDAHLFASKIIRSAKKSIIILDNYIDESVLALLTKRKKGVTIKIYTKNISRQLSQDIDKFSQQYGKITVVKMKIIHDRFIIIDENKIYHSGASLKDLGKKISAFSKFDKDALELLGKLK